MSHDLATYVTRLRLRIALLPEGPQTARAQRDLEEMQALLADTLDFARGSFTGRDGASTTSRRWWRRNARRGRRKGPLSISARRPFPAARGGALGSEASGGANLIGNAIAYGGGRTSPS